MKSFHLDSEAPGDFPATPPTSTEAKRNAKNA
jgi:hypothetical protein